MQYEITNVIPVLDSNGNLVRPGYAKKPLPLYDRSRIKGGPMRRKEWDSYLVMNDSFALILTVADHGCLGVDSIALLDFREGWEVTRNPINVLPLGKTGLPVTSVTGDTASAGKGHALVFRVRDGRRELFAHMDNFMDGKPLDAHIVLEREPEESMVICAPFDKPGLFCYNRKINCMRAAGTVTVGERSRIFDPSCSFGTLDWSRGVWPRCNTWHWGSASGLADGIPFGFNIGYGCGDTSAASENMLFYGGKAHKLSQVTFRVPMKDGEEDYLLPWTFTSDNGRFEMEFEPVLYRTSCTDIKLIRIEQNQVFGRFTGTVVLDDGRQIRVNNFMGFAQKVENKW